jgi:AraC family transcriptional regulator
MSGGSVQDGVVGDRFPERRQPMQFEGPRIVTMKAMAVVGMPCFSDNKHGEFKAMWDAINARMERVPGRLSPRRAYGLQWYTAEFSTLGKWFYMPCVEVEHLNPIPEEMVGKTLPEYRYAVFTLKGGLSQLGELYQFMYHGWLPASPYVPAAMFDFEVYDDRFRDVDHPATAVDICIPLKDK